MARNRFTALTACSCYNILDFTVESMTLPTQFSIFIVICERINSVIP